MTTIPLTFISPPLTQNQVRRMHYQTEAKLKRTIIAATVTSIRRAKTAPVEGPVEVVLHYRPGTRRRFDSDGLAPSLKCFLDALVDTKVLPDDSWQYVPFSGVRIHEPNPNIPAAMWLEIQEN